MLDNERGCTSAHHRAQNGPRTAPFDHEDTIDPNRIQIAPTKHISRPIESTTRKPDAKGCETTVTSCDAGLGKTQRGLGRQNQ